MLDISGRLMVQGGIYDKVYADPVVASVNGNLCKIDRSSLPEGIEIGDIITLGKADSEGVYPIVSFSKPGKKTRSLKMRKI